MIIEFFYSIKAAPQQTSTKHLTKQRQLNLGALSVEPTDNCVHMQPYPERSLFKKPYGVFKSITDDKILIK